MSEIRQWLPHLSGEIISPARSYNICSYSIALEAWRRGLQVRIHDKAFNHYSITLKREIKIFGFAISSKTISYSMNRSLIKKTPKESKDICRNKDLAKQFLIRANVPVAQGKRFRPETSNEEILDYAKKLGFPVVLKPNNSTLGFGVYENIKDEATLKEKLTLLRDELKRKDVLIEQHIEGEEYRLFVINNKVIGAIKRVPANILGNGVDSVQCLIEQKNKSRRKNPFLFRWPILIDDEVLKNLNKVGYNLDSIPGDGELIFLRERPSLINGGDSIDVTDTISEEVKKTAIKANNAIPNLISSGIDIIVPRVRNSQGVVLELNYRPQIGNILFPVKGQARDIPSAIIDYLFPDSKKYMAKNRKLYFDIKGALKPLKEGLASEITLPPSSTGHLTYRKIKVIGDVQNDDFKCWAKKEASRLKLNGFVKNLSTGGILIVVAGKKTDILTFKELCEKGRFKTKIEKIKMSKWNKPVMSGFKIK